MQADITERIVAQCYNAAAGRGDWETALDGINDVCQAWATQMFALDKRNGTALFSHYGGGARAEAHLAYLQTYQRIDPRAPMVMASRTTDWFHCHQVFTDDMVAASPFYQDFLIPVGARYVSAIKLVDDDDMGVLLAILRGVGTQPLEPGTLAWLDSLRFHMAEALAIARHLGSLHLERMVGQTVLDRLAQPIFLVDAARTLRYANAAAQAALTAASAVHAPGGVLRCSNSGDDAKLTEALDALVVAAPTSGPVDRQFVRLRGPNAHQAMGISLSVLRPMETAGCFGELPLAMLVLHDSAQATAGDPFIIQELFGLTPAEAQVGTLLCQGMGLDDIATRRGVSLNTVRNQMSTLLSKTGSTRQADLVAKLLSQSHGIDAATA